MADSSSLIVLQGPKNAGLNLEAVQSLEVPDLDHLGHHRCREVKLSIPSPLGLQVAERKERLHVEAAAAVAVGFENLWLLKRC